MNPYYHACSSHRTHGGTVEDYIPLHNFFDASKACLAWFTHRCINHHHQGIEEAVKIFGEFIVNADGAKVPVRMLALQHLAEDMSIIPSAADWLQHMVLPDTGGPIRPAPHTPDAERLAAASARHFETTPDVMLPLHSWFLETAAWIPDHRHFALRHHSFGCFQAETRFGAVLSETNPIPTRVAGEYHVRTVLGHIPATADFLRRIKGQPWMAAANNAHRRGLA